MEIIFITFFMLLIGIVVASALLKKGPQKHRSSDGGDAGFLHGEHVGGHGGDASGNDGGGSGGGDGGGGGGGGGD